MSGGGGGQWEAAAQLARRTGRGGVQCKVRKRDGHITDNPPHHTHATVPPSLSSLHRRPSWSQTGGEICEFIHILRYTEECAHSEE